MTKARTKGARRRARANLITLHGGQQVEARPTGRDRWHTQQPEPPADLVALTARSRRAGCALDEAKDALAGDDIGRCIRFIHHPVEARERLSVVWEGLVKSWHNYRTRCLGLPPGPQSSSLPMLPDQAEIDRSLTVDTRTADQKAEAARESWFAWLDALQELPKESRHALRGHLQGYGAEVWCPIRLRPTAAGVLAIAALEALRKRWD